MYSTNSLYSNSTASQAADMGVWMIIALVLALIGGVLVYFLFVNSKNNPKGKFLQWLKQFLAFKIMWIEPIMKVIYYVLTIYVVLFSFSLISVSFLAFIGCLVLGPIAIRLVYEATMMFIMIWRNTKDIAENTKK